MLMERKLVMKAQIKIHAILHEEKKRFSSHKEIPKG
jgi:hypothetical protein